MEWSLTIVALALIAVAAVSKPLSGSPITPAMLFVSIGILVGPKVLDEIDIESTSSTVQSTRRGDAGARTVLRLLAHRPWSAPA